VVDYSRNWGASSRRAGKGELYYSVDLCHFDILTALKNLQCHSNMSRKVILIPVMSLFLTVYRVAKIVISVKTAERRLLLIDLRSTFRPQPVIKLQLLYIWTCTQSRVCWYALTAPRKCCHSSAKLKCNVGRHDRGRRPLSIVRKYLLFGYFQNLSRILPFQLLLVHRYAIAADIYFADHAVNERRHAEL